MRGQLLAQPFVQGLQPGQFIDVFVGIDFLAVRDIRVDEADAVDGGGDNARLRILETRIIFDDILDRQPRQNCHPVIGLLAGINHLITRRIYFRNRELIVG